MMLYDMNLQNGDCIVDLSEVVSIRRFTNIRAITIYYRSGKQQQDVLFMEDDEIEKAYRGIRQAWIEYKAEQAGGY